MFSDYSQVVQRMKEWASQRGRKGEGGKAMGATCKYAVNQAKRNSGAIYCNSSMSLKFYQNKVQFLLPKKSNMHFKKLKKNNSR